MKVLLLWLHLGTLTMVLYRSLGHRPLGPPSLLQAGWEPQLSINPRKDLWTLVTHCSCVLPRSTSSEARWPRYQIRARCFISELQMKRAEWEGGCAGEKAEMVTDVCMNHAGQHSSWVSSISMIHTDADGHSLSSIHSYSSRPGSVPSFYRGAHMLCFVLSF